MKKNKKNIYKLAMFTYLLFMKCLNLGDLYKYIIISFILHVLKEIPGNLFECTKYLDHKKDTRYKSIKYLNTRYKIGTLKLCIWIQDTRNNNYSTYLRYVSKILVSKILPSPGVCFEWCLFTKLLKWVRHYKKDHNTNGFQFILYLPILR